MLVAFLALLKSRLQADKKRYLLTLDHIESAATQAGAITGVAGALAADLDRCRSTEAFRRKAGELLHESYPFKDRDQFQKKLKQIDRSWGRVEDAVTRDPIDPPQVRTAQLLVVEEFQQLKTMIKKRSKWRLSLLIFGRLPPASES